MPKEIRIETVATAKGATTRVFVDGELKSDRTLTREGSGMYRGTKPGDVYEDLPDHMADVADVAESADVTDLVRFLNS